MRRILVLSVSIALSADRATAEMVRLPPIADTTLFETAPTNNLGRITSLAAGTTARAKRSRALLRFDLAGAIPSNATIVNATLTLAVVRAPSGSGGVDSIFGLHRMLRAWNEGTKAIEPLGAPAGLGETTWLARAHPATAWSEPGAADPVDYVTEETSSQLIGNLGAYEFTGVEADVRTWQQNPASNFGWILISQDELTPATARRFGSRENTNSPPVLGIEFTRAQAARPRIVIIERTSNNLRMQFQAEAGVAYAVEHRATVTGGVWLTLTNVAPAGTPRDVVVVDRVEMVNRFYRVIGR